MQDKFTIKSWAEQNGVKFPVVSDANKEYSPKWNDMLPEVAGVKNMPNRSVMVIDSNMAVRGTFQGAPGGPIPDAKEVLRLCQSL